MGSYKMMLQMKKTPITTPSPYGVFVMSVPNEVHTSWVCVDLASSAPSFSLRSEVHNHLDQSALYDSLNLMLHIIGEDPPKEEFDGACLSRESFFKKPRRV